MATLNIRQDVAPAAAGVDSGSRGDDAPSLLFFYLFDDWYTTYSLVVRRQDKYGEKLRDLACLPSGP